MSTPVPMSASSDSSNELRINNGGQAVLEGVMMRGRRVAATAVRHPAGHIVLKAEALDPRRLSQRLRRVPFGAAGWWHCGKCWRWGCAR